MKPTGDHSEIPNGVDLENRILKLSVVLNHKTKDFKYEFDGEWRGRDVKVVMNHLFREYRQHLRKIRKEFAEQAETPVQEETPSPEEPRKEHLTFMAATGEPPIADTYTDREETPPAENKEEPPKRRRRKKEENIDG